MNTPYASIPALRLPRKASGIDDIFDFLDLIFNLIDLLNSIIDTIRNFGDFLNGN